MKTKWLEDVDPVSFGYVMATGVLSTAFYVTGWTTLSFIFLILASLGYIGLIGLFAASISFYPKAFFQQLLKVETLFKCLTFSAGTNKLATRLALSGYDHISLILAFIGILSTILLVYGIFCVLFFHAHASIQLISPYWLLVAIAVHSCDIILATLWTEGQLTQPFFLLLAFLFWTFAFLSYVFFMALNIYRFFFVPFDGKDLNPSYWTCMGAAAIAVFGASKLILVPNAPDFLIAVKPFFQGIILLLWCWGTAWIPILCLMLVWKYGYYKIPFYYEPSLWAIAFPLGMYTLATYMIQKSISLTLVQSLVPIFLWITFFVWLLFIISSGGIIWRSHQKGSKRRQNHG